MCVCVCVCARTCIQVKICAYVVYVILLSIEIYFPTTVAVCEMCITMTLLAIQDELETQQYCSFIYKIRKEREFAFQLMLPVQMIISVDVSHVKGCWILS